MNACRALPDFPRTGTAHLAGHADPRVRAPGARDPDTQPASSNGSPMTPAPRSGRPWPATRTSRPPPPRLTELLADPELTHAAGANPAPRPETVDRRGAPRRPGP
ncbi:hypothetical protein ACWDE9_36095, partial [Streptomyces olivaceoviridis]